MDSYENEASKFAAQRTKLKNICEAHDLTYTFIKNSYPIKLIIRPIKGVGEQMSMLETASEDSYISPDAYLLFTMKDGVLVYVADSCLCAACIVQRAENAEPTPDGVYSYFHPKQQRHLCQSVWRTEH